MISSWFDRFTFAAKLPGIVDGERGLVDDHPAINAAIECDGHPLRQNPGEDAFRS